MIPEERRLEIIQEVRARSLVRADELADRFGVSGETIRRDLMALEREGLVRRVHGGATSSGARGFEASYEQRRATNLEAKRAMARVAADLIEPGDTIVLDIGTSAAEVARALPPAHRGRVLTNSLLVAIELAGREGVEVLTSGGRVRAGDLACSGTQAETFFGDYFADKAFLGSGGVHPEVGLTDYYPDEIASRRIILEHASERYVLADSSKLGRIALARVCGLDQLTAVITDDGADDRVVEELEREGLRVLVASTVPTNGQAPMA